LIFSQGKLSESQAAGSSARLDELSGWSTMASPVLRQARARYDQARATAWTQRTLLLPRVDLRLSRSWSELATAPAAPDQDSWQLIGQWSLYSRASWLQGNRAAVDLERAELDLVSAENQLRGELLRGLGLWLLVQYRETSIELSLQVATENQNEAEIRVRSGSRTRIDLLKAQSQVASLKAQKATLEVDRLSAVDVLANSLGLERQEIEERLPALIRLPKELRQREAALSTEIESLVGSPPLVGLGLGGAGPQRLWFRDNSLAGERARLQREFDDAGGALIWSTHWPDLSLRVTTGRQVEAGSLRLDWAKRDTTAALVLNIPLFSFGSGFSDWAASSAARVQAELRQRQSLDESFSAFTGLVERERALRAQIQALQIALARQVEIESLTNRSFQLGRATSLEVQIAQNELLQSRLSLAQATFELAQAVHELSSQLRQKQ
jgi:outer membrane protein TolC